MTFNPVQHTFIASSDALPAALEDITAAEAIGIDLETTGLDARHDSTRLIAIATPRHCWVIDVTQVNPAPLLPVLSKKKLVGHNLAFDLGFLACFGFEPGAVQDTMLLSNLLHAGAQGVRHSLAEVARRHLGIDLSKELQQSDWTGTLSRAQVAYSAEDAAVLLPLAENLMAAVTESDLGRAAELENRCLPALVWMARSGVPVDVDAWKAVAAEVEQDAVRLRLEMDMAAPQQWVLDLGLGRNWDNAQVVRDALRDADIDVANVNDEALSAIDHPLAVLLRQYRENRKLASTYGLDWLKHVHNGRAYPDWRQLGATSGRMACSNPNLQQIPRAQRYRSCIAAPPGRVLIKADFSQIELRIAARIAGEDRMLRAYQSGEDLHLLTAQRVLGKAEISRSDRQLAKAINFGLLYGMGAEGFQRYARAQYGVPLSLDDAAHYREAFFEAYPRLRAWHRSNRDDRSTETRTLTGRRRYMDAETPLPLRLNTPVQGTGADGLKRALALLWERRGQSPEAAPIITCHDEIVVECPADRAVEAAEWLRQAMVDGMAPLIHPVPVEVELSVGQNWAGGAAPVPNAVAPPAGKAAPEQLSLF